MATEEVYKLSYGQDWGGFYEEVGGEPRPATGEEVQKFIKESKVGYTHVLANQEIKGTKYHVLLGFADESTMKAWENEIAAQPENKEAIDKKYIISRAEIPAAQPEAGYLIKFQSKSDRNIISTEGRVILECRFNTFLYDPSTNTTDFMVETGRVNVYKQIGDGGFELVDNKLIKIDNTNKVYIDGINPETTTYNLIDITDALSGGKQDIKVEIIGQTSNLTTSYIYKVNNAQIGLTFNNKDWIQDVVGVSNPSMQLFFKIKGNNIAKQLNVKISIGKENGVIKYREYSRRLESDGSYDNYPFPDLTDPRLFSHGVHDIEAWIDVPGTTNRSNTVHAQIMIVSDANDDTPFAIINNVKDPIENWVNQTFFSYAIYSSKFTSLPISIVMTDLDETTKYLMTPYISTNVGDINDYINTLSINNSTPNFSIKSKIQTLHNDEVLVLWEQKISVKSGAYSPKSGSTFSIDPSNRYNDEQDPKKIINASDPSMVINSTWDNMQFNNVSGWIGVENEYGIYKCLSLLSGQQLNIEYNPFKSWVKEQSNTPYGAFEFDFMVNNILDQRTPLIRICKNNILGGIEYPVGFELRGLDAMVGLTDEANRLVQDVAFREGVRTHIMVVYSQNPNLVKIYINGCLTRIIGYDDITKIFDIDDKPFYIKFGNIVSGADIKIYNFRTYEGVDLKNDDVFQNYLSTLPTTEAKDLLIAKNNICDDEGNIDYNLVKSKYNTLVWESLDGKSAATLATFGNSPDDTYPGNLRINIIGDQQRSGLITNLSVKGQGTSSMNYYRWNQRWEFDKLKDANNKKIESKFISNAGEAYNKTGCYQLCDGIPFAKRLDGKINWASSMQSHKMGSCDLYHELWKLIVGNNTITSTPGGTDFTKTPNGYADCRVSIKQLPFFVFVDDVDGEGNIVKKFAGLFTMGPSKGDKPTFGYDSAKWPDFVMMEGCNNDQPLIMCRVPWNDEDVVFDGPKLKEDIYYYLSTPGVWSSQWEISMGDVDMFQRKNTSGEYTGVYKIFKEMSNFIYTCNPYLNPISSYADLDASENTYKDEFYWIQTADQARGYEKYELFRFDSYVQKWVRAGIEHTEDEKRRDGAYEPLNLSDGIDFNPDDYSSSDLNQKFIEMRVKKFSDGIAKYINTDDLQFTLQFLKLIAASDNWSKNTYLYTTGFKADGTFDPIRFFQDDMDTIFATNNVGNKTKVYYIEEHDGEEVEKNPNGILAAYKVPNQSYWVSSKNALYTLAEKAYDMKLTMYNILVNCAKLSGSTDKTADEALFDCFKKYYFDKVADAFPIKAYNEISKMYIEAKQSGHKFPENPLAQVTGNAIEGESQWMKQRLIYLSSYAGFGIFGQGDGTGGSGGFVFRTPNSGSGYSGSTFNIDLTPSMWLYPSVDVVGNRARAARTSPQKLIEKDGRKEWVDNPVRININAGVDQTMVIQGMDYLKSMGDLSTLATQTSYFEISSTNLQDFTITKNTLFQPTGLGFGFAPKTSIPNLKSITLSSSNGLKSITKVSIGNDAPRLESIDLTGTSVSELILPTNSNVKVIKLPKTITTLVIDGLKNLTNDTFILADYEKLEKLTIKNMDSDKFDTYSIFSNCVAKSHLEKLELNNINWTNVSLDYLNYLLDIQTLDITGSIYMDKNVDINSDLKMRLIERFGNIDNKSNKLYIEYTKKSLTEEEYVKIIGNSNIYTEGSHQFTLYYPAGKDITANDFTSISWSVSDTQYGNITKGGVFEYNGKANSNEKISIEVVCVIQHPGNPKGLTTSKKIYLYPRLAKVGDYVYADGSYGDPLEDTGFKDIIATCFYVDGSEDVNNQKRLAVSVEALHKPYCYYGELKDISGIDNITSSGATAVSYPYYLYKADMDAYLQNPSDPKFDKTAISDLGWDNGTPRGEIYTNALIAQRDKRVVEISGKAPNKDEFVSILENVAGDDEGKTAARLAYYPAASYCRFYQPNVDNLNNRFESGNWFLPSIGELMQIWYLIRHSDEETDKSKYLAASKYANEIQSSDIVWSSSEYSEYYAWAIKFTEHKYDYDYDHDYIAGWETVGSEKFAKKSWDRSSTYVLLPVVSF